MSAKLAEMLKEKLSKRRAEALQAEIRKPVSERIGKEARNAAIDADWLFQTPVGTHRPTCARYCATIETTREDAGDTLSRPRHTFASLLLEQRESLTRVKEQMGHSSVNMTVDIHGHLVPGSINHAAHRLDDEIAV